MNLEKWIFNRDSKTLYKDLDTQVTLLAVPVKTKNRTSSDLRRLAYWLEMRLSYKEYIPNDKWDEPGKFVDRNVMVKFIPDWQLMMVHTTVTTNY